MGHHADRRAGVKHRRLRITADLWVDALKKGPPIAFRVAENALPIDARCVRMEEDPETPNMLFLWLESDAFRDHDPDELPDPILETIETR
jgi:hypothetical protein